MKFKLNNLVIPFFILFTFSLLCDCVKEKTLPVQNGTQPAKELKTIITNSGEAWKRITVEAYKYGYMRGVIDTRGDSVNLDLSVERFKNKHKYLEAK